MLEPIRLCERSEIVANKLGTIVSVADFRNSMTREMGFCAFDHGIRECLGENLLPSSLRSGRQLQDS